jgi:hypothetical protein
MNTTCTADLKSLTDDALTERYAAADEAEVIVAIVAEMDRRERKTRQSAKDAARWAAVYDEWAVAAHAQYLAAEDICRGNLVNKASLADVTDPFSLWTGSRAWAERCATEELREFWDANPRLTVSAFREQQRRADREARAAAGL